LDDYHCAHPLTAGVPYVRNWNCAADTARELAEQLAACGLADQVPHLRADVNTFGTPLIQLGAITPETASILAALLAIARQHQSAEEPEAAKESPADT
jgi:hypothetical protein